MKYLLISCCLAGSLCAQQQPLKDNYTPLTSQNPLPELFTDQFRAIVQKEVNALKQAQAANADEVIYTYAGIETFIRSGNILVNDEVSAYLGKVADVLLESKPELRSSLHIYAYKSPVVNAHSFSNGYILVNTGLVAQAENEAQLAYLLAREIAHVSKKHVLGHRGQPAKLVDGVYTFGRNEDDELAELYAYSPADEAGADVEAYNLYKQSGYSARQVQKAFGLLQYSHLPFELVEFKTSFFETGGYKLPERYALKNVSSIASKGNTSDLEGMHPDINKRKYAVEALISSDNSPGKSNYMVGESSFMYVRDLARLELCRLFLKGRDYPNALYASYILLQTYPDNAYLHEVVSKCLYGICLFNREALRYTSESSMPDGIKNYSAIESYPQQMYYLVNKMPANEWLFMSLNYAYRSHKRFPANRGLAVVADSLFKLVAGTDWGINDFVRTNVKDEPPADNNPEPKSKTELIANIQKEKDQKHLDTMYYKDVYMDLFMSDKEFSAKFPKPGAPVVYAGKPGFKDYKRTVTYLKTDTVILAAPFNYYLGFNSGTEEIEPNLKPGEDDLSKIMQTASGKAKYAMIITSPETAGPDEAGKLNDYSAINDWIFEKTDERNSKNLVLNTGQAAYLLEKYKTPYVLRFGSVLVHGRKGGMIFYTEIYDLRKNCAVFKRVENVPSSNYYMTLTAKAYQVINELKFHKLPEQEID